MLCRFALGLLKGVAPEEVPLDSPRIVAVIAGATTIAAVGLDGRRECLRGRDSQIEGGRSDDTLCACLNYI
jgi:hypothetical protein